MQEIIWNEAGQVRRLKGKIIDEKGDFITLDALGRTFRINKAIIIKIEETTEENEDG